MTNDIQPNIEYNVEVVFVDKQNGVIDVEGDFTGQYQVVFPADMKWAKSGPAVAKLNNVGQINYLRSTAPKQNTPYKKPYQPNGFKPFKQSNPIKANEYEPEEKESKYIGLTLCKENITLSEFTKLYNDMSIANKWIVASNVFPRKDGNYDCVFFIKEKREGLDTKPYFPQSHQDSQIKVQNMGTY